MISKMKSGCLCVSCADGRLRFWRFDPLMLLLLLLLELTPHGAVCLGSALRTAAQRPRPLGL